MTQIKFGTDGWRAVIAKDYTFDNLERVARAAAQWLHDTTDADVPRVVLGHDCRFQGRAFAEHVACVFAQQGVHVTFASTFAPTPAISWATKAFDCDAGIVITASHNPPEYNGFKIKAAVGGPAAPEQVAEVEARIEPLPDDRPTLPAFATLVDAGDVAMRDVRGEYMAMLTEQIDLDAIRASGLRVAHDAMFGAGRGVLVELLGDEHVVELRGDDNPGFHGQAPEPIERNLDGLLKTVVLDHCDAGIANDGDADRIGMVDENGVFVSSHQLLALLAKYLHEERGLSGEIVKTFSTTHMLDAMAEHYDLPLHVTPIGFKYIGPRIVEGDVLVGGEESGGIAVKGHIPERDGLYIGLLILEMMVRRGKSLSALVGELFEAFGPHFYHRIDAHTTPERKERILGQLADGGLTEIAGHAVTEVQTLDGYKHLTDGGWLLVRPSGTEPVLRVYAEAESPAAAAALVEDAVDQLDVRA